MARIDIIVPSGKYCNSSKDEYGLCLYLDNTYCPIFSKELCVDGKCRLSRCKDCIDAEIERLNNG